MKKVILVSLAMICLVFASCGDNNSEDQEVYSYKMETIYKGDDSYEIMSEQFQYYNDTLYGIVNNIEDADNMTFEIVTIDLSSGEQNVCFDKDRAKELGKIKDFAFDNNGDMWILSVSESYILSKVIDGKVQMQITIDSPLPSEESPSDPILYIEEKGQFYINFEFEKIFVLNTAGETVAEISCDGWIRGFRKLNDKTYVAYNGAAGSSYCIAEVNTDKKELGASTTVAEGIVISDVCSAEELGGQYCYYNESGVYIADNEGNSTALFTWTDHGLVELYPNRIFVTSEGDILCCNWDLIVIMKRVSAEEADQRQVLTLAAVDVGEALKNMVANFNRTSEEYMVSLVDYSTYGTDTDKYAGLNKLNTEIISGNPPDLIDLRNIDAEQYITKGILEDLYPYIDKDPDLNREDYLENVLTAMGDGNALYGLTTTFRINTVVAKTSEMDLSNWNYQGMKEMLLSNPEIFLGGTKSGLLELACTYMQDNFVDWNKNTASFDSPEFISFLEACNTLPEETEIKEIYDIKLFDPDNSSAYAGVNFSSFSDLMTIEDIWGTDASLIGYPETGSTIGLRMYLGILSESSNKEASWSFLRTALMKEAQEPQGEWVMGFPISKSAFEKIKSQATAVYETGGVIVNGEQLEISIPTEEQVDKVAELALSLDKLSSNNTVIKDIVLEEAESYFAGDKTAKEAAEIIQNRVTIYINEQA